MATIINFTVDAGSSFEGVVVIQNEDGSIFDLNGLVPYSQMRKSYYTSAFTDIIAEVNGDPKKGEIKLSMPPTTTEQIKPSRYVYDVEVHNPLNVNYVKRVVEGIITVYPQVTRQKITPATS